MSRPVKLTPAAAGDIARPQDDYEAREPGLGNRFAQQVRSTLTRIGQNPLHYQVVPDSLGNRRAPVRQFPFGVWYQVLPDESVLIASGAPARCVAGASPRRPASGTVVTLISMPAYSAFIEAVNHR